MIKAITIAARIPVAVCSDLNLRPQFGQFTAKTETEWPHSGQGFRFRLLTSPRVQLAFVLVYLDHVA